MSAERGAAGNTLEAYRRDLVDYSSFLKSRGTAVERALPEDVSAYASGLEAAGLKGTTIQRRLSAVSATPPLPVRRTIVPRQSCNLDKRCQARRGTANRDDRERVTRLLAQARSEAETAGRGQRLRPTARLSRRAALCHGFARVGAGRTEDQCRRKGTGPPGGAGQGRARADGADLAAPAMRSSFGSSFGRAGHHSSRMNASFPRMGAPGTCRGNISRSN